MNAEQQISEEPVKAIAESPETDSPDEPEGWEEELDVYPLRDPSEDPGWAIKTVKIWLYFCSFSFIFCLVLVILGIWYD